MLFKKIVGIVMMFLDFLWNIVLLIIECVMLGLIIFIKLSVWMILGYFWYVKLMNVLKWNEFFKFLIWLMIDCFFLGVWLLICKIVKISELNLWFNGIFVNVIFVFLLGWLIEKFGVCFKDFLESESLGDILEIFVNNFLSFLDFLFELRLVMNLMLFFISFNNCLSCCFKLVLSMVVMFF